MTLKDLAPKTQQNYQHTLSKLAVDYGRPLHRLTADEVSSWVIGRIDAGLAEQTTNADVSALRLFYNDAMGQPDKVAGLHGRRVHDRLPRSISEADVLALIQGDPRSPLPYRNPHRLWRRLADLGSGRASSQRHPQRKGPAPDRQWKGRPRTHNLDTRSGPRHAATLLECHRPRTPPAGCFSTTTRTGRSMAEETTLRDS